MESKKAQGKVREKNGKEMKSERKTKMLKRKARKCVKAHVIAYAQGGLYHVTFYYKVLGEERK